MTHDICLSGAAPELPSASPSMQARLASTPTSCQVASATKAAFLIAPSLWLDLLAPPEVDE